MKKALIAIISSIYVIAIIIVSFLGANASFSSTDTYVTSLELTNESLLLDETKTGTQLSDYAIRIYPRPNEAIIDPTTGKDKRNGIQWNYGEDLSQKRDYAIKIPNAKYFYDYLNGTLTLNIKVYPIEATVQDLTYTVYSESTEVQNSIKINSNTLTFTQGFPEFISGDITVSTVDGSGVKLDIWFQVYPYNS